ncbi:MAG TPA: protein nirF [Rhizobiales bacterium]|nr:protein nirF [Hyphomicrobiales bacterium]
MIGRRKFLQGAGLAGAASLAGTNAGAEEPAKLRGTGDLGVVIERATGSVQIVETTGHTSLARIEGLGDLSHAVAVFSRDERYAYVFGRDGGLSKVDILAQKLVRRIVQSGNSIGGAISDDGRLIAVSNYTPGGVRLFNAQTLEPVLEIPARYDNDGALSKVVGLTDAPGGRFVFTLYDAGEIWIADCSKCLSGQAPQITKLKNIGLQPYDALINATGRYYIAGMFGEDGMAMIDLWQSPLKVRRILDGYGRGEKKLPVYKMPHLEGWTNANGHYYLPAVGHHEVLVADAETFKQTAAIPVHGQPVFVMARPDERQIWVNFAHPLNDTVQVIDVPSGKIIRQFKPGPAVLHMEFTARGEQVWISVRDENRIDVYDTNRLERIATLPARSPSGIFFTWRAGRIGL